MIIMMPSLLGKGKTVPTSRFLQTNVPQGVTLVPLGPFWAAPRAVLYLGDVRACLRRLPSRSVHSVVTSPPYWNLRDYGTGSAQIGMEPSPDCGTYGQAQCGECFVCSIVGVIREVHRVLRDDGTLWLNLGDTFDNGEQGMIPALVALALRKDGWKLIQDIIWYAPNKMPESVTNRCTKSHEHIFLLAKGGEYYYDSIAIEEQSATAGKPLGFTTVQADAIGKVPSGNQLPENYSKPRGNTKNKRDVWIVPVARYPGAHFATFSPRLITPCILAGTSEHGCCAKCGKPWDRVTVKTVGQVNERREKVNSLSRDRSFDWSRNGKPGSGSTLDGAPATQETVGWHKVCGCQTNDVVSCTVLDPFVGSGTTVATAIQLGRTGIGIDLSEVYLRENAIPRIEAAIQEATTGKATTPVPPCMPLPPRKIRE